MPDTDPPINAAFLASHEKLSASSERMAEEQAELVDIGQQMLEPALPGLLNPAQVMSSLILTMLENMPHPYSGDNVPTVATIASMYVDKLLAKYPNCFHIP